MVMVLIGSACSHVNRATLVASTAALACDWAQTRELAGDGWRTHRETNPMLGERPTTNVIDTYFLAAAIVNATVWAVMPERFRSVIAGGVAARQGLAIGRNLSEDASACGF